MKNRRKQNPTVQLSTERALKLKDLAGALGLTSMSAVVGELLKLAAEQGLVSHDLPGIELRRLSDGISIRFDDSERIGFSFAAARSMADTLRGYVEGSAHAAEPVHRDEGFLVSRRGNGIAVQLKGPAGPQKIFSRDVAKDFASLIERAHSGTSASIAETNERASVRPKDTPPLRGCNEMK